MVRKGLHKSDCAMAYKYRWLSQALEDMAHEIQYVYNEFGLSTARQAESKVREGVRQLCQFPYSGLRYEEDVLYKGQEVRVLHLRQISVIYSIENEMITLVAIWNNYQDPNKLNDIIKTREE